MAAKALSRDNIAPIADFVSEKIADLKTLRETLAGIDLPNAAELDLELLRTQHTALQVLGLASLLQASLIGLGEMLDQFKEDFTAATDTTEE